MKAIIKHVPVTILVSVLIGITSCHSEAGRSAESESVEETAVSGGNSEPVVITRAQFQNASMQIGGTRIVQFQQLIKANGYMEASPQGKVSVSSHVPGMVTAIFASPGEYVSKGETLFTIEGNEIIQLQQEYGEAYSNLLLLKSSYERYQLLSEENIAAGKELIRAESEYRSMVAKAGGLKARLKLLGLSPARVVEGEIVPVIPIASPVSGYITRFDLVLGQVIQPDMAVMEVIDTDQLQLNVFLFSKDLTAVAEGQPVEYYSPENEAEIFTAELMTVGKSIDENTKTVRCIASVSNDQRGRFANMAFVEARIITCEREALAIPVEALVEEDGRYYILQKTAESETELTFRKVPVKIGVIQGEFAEVTEGELKDVLLKGTYDLFGE